jgi:hypothetical protein
MKKQVSLFASALLLALGAQAQITLIPKAGITVTSISYDEVPAGQKGRIGFVGGAGVEIASSKISFRCNLNCFSSRRVNNTKPGE